MDDVLWGFNDDLSGKEVSSTLRHNNFQCSFDQTIEILEMHTSFLKKKNDGGLCWIFFFHPNPGEAVVSWIINFRQSKAVNPAQLNICLGLSFLGFFMFGKIFGVSYCRWKLIKIVFEKNFLQKIRLNVQFIWIYNSAKCHMLH